MAGELSGFAVLVPGRLHAHAVKRVAEQFRLMPLERSDPALLTAEMREQVVAIATFGNVSAVMMDALPRLSIIANFGVGYDSVDAVHAAQKGIMVTHTPDVLTEEVADTALGLLINTVRELPKAERYLREGRWRTEGPYPLTRGSLRGRTVGIYGMGRIGRAVAQRIEAFGLSIAYHNRRRIEDVAYAYYPSLLSLAEAVDTLICVVPGGAATEKSVNADILRALGPSGVFINVGRGTTVDEEALAAALRSGTILAAGLDVFANEPNVSAALLSCENACLLPHVASASAPTRQAMADLVVDNLISWFSRGVALTPVPETVHLNTPS